MSNQNILLDIDGNITCFDHREMIIKQNIDFYNHSNSLNIKDKVLLNKRKHDIIIKRTPQLVMERQLRKCTDNKLLLQSFCEKLGSIIQLDEIKRLCEKYQITSLELFIPELFKTNICQNVNEYISKNIEFNNQQIEATEIILKWLQDNDNQMFGLYGYAGTGKTTLVVNLVLSLMSLNYVKNIVITAPTNKALDVLRSKFEPLRKKLIEEFGDRHLTNNNSIDDDTKYQLLKAYNEHLKTSITFTTLHRLLNYSVCMNEDGIEDFCMRKMPVLKDYDIVIIDECSMISTMLFKNIAKHAKPTTKILFTGDPAQLPPVNEDMSCVYDNVNHSFTLTDIMRNKNVSVTKVTLYARDWISNELPLKRVKGNYVTHTYDFNEWISSALEYFKNEDESTVILSWTNKQCDEYNNIIRTELYKDEIETLTRIMHGERMILKRPLRISNTCILHTSLQIQVFDPLPISVNVRPFLYGSNSDKQHKIDYSMMNEIHSSNIKDIIRTYLNKFTTTLLCTSITIVYQSKNYVINTLNDGEQSKIDFNRKNIIEAIKQCKTYLKRNGVNDLKHFNSTIVIPLWASFSDLYISKFADLTYAYAVTIHREQGSQKDNVFVDFKDIKLNKRDKEMKRCYYTALTRSSNTIHIYE